ncbi:MAG: hypothetical protein LBT99_02375 [Bifidobacteriaceae bacterium]|jgi:hypothetical protein|nr:hypothetical protein [Bifidobacteriaceae bacterium]
MLFLNSGAAVLIFLGLVIITILVIFRVNKYSNRVFTISEKAFGKDYIFHLYQSYKHFRILATVGMVLIVISTICLVGRPASLLKNVQNHSNSDIELCLDVSGSALVYDKKIVEFYRNSIGDFSGQRIGLTIFNSTARQVFPLTVDYKLAKSRLDEAYNAFKNINDRLSLNSLSETDLQTLALFIKGTSTNSAANSLIGDGLASCVLAFGDTGDNNYIQGVSREKTIIFATDNALAGNPIYTLEQAMILVKQNNIKLQSIYLPSDDSVNVDNSDNMRFLTNRYGGNYYDSTDPKIITSIISDINANTNITVTDQSKRYIDFPQIFVLVLLTGLILYLLSIYKINE